MGCKQGDMRIRSHGKAAQTEEQRGVSDLSHFSRPDSLGYLPIPTKRQIFRVINDFIFFIFTLTLTDLLFLLLLSLLPCPCLLTLHVLVGEVSLFLQWEKRLSTYHDSKKVRANSCSKKLPQCTEGGNRRRVWSREFPPYSAKQFQFLVPWHFLLAKNETLYHLLALPMLLQQQPSSWKQSPKTEGKEQGRSSKGLQYCVTYAQNRCGAAHWCAAVYESTS